jgi:hypothetical protein
MEAHVSIGDPILESGEHFNVRYRLLPDGEWVDFGEVNTNNFTISDLEVGVYEIEISFVREDGIICAPLIIEHEVEDVPFCGCGYISDVYVKRNCLQKMANIYVTFEDNFDCATLYKLTYTQFGGTSPNTIEYTENPGLVTLTIPDIGSTLPPRITVEIECCDGTTKTCYDMPITDIRECDCTVAPTILNGSIQYTSDPTPQHSIQINFNAGSPTPSTPYSVTYYQLNTIDPVTPTVVSETSAGFKSYDVDIEPYFGELMFRVVVETPCGSDQKDISVVQCGQTVNYIGGETFPTIVALYIGGATGYMYVNYNALSIPDKFEIVNESGTVVASSGYRGNISYQEALDDNLDSRGLPPEPIVGDGAGSLYHHIVTPADWIFVHVYAPLSGTQWSFNTLCQLTPVT